jgi:arsenate reductase
MSKKVLILCTGNSCRSIMAEGLINHNLEGIEASSAGVRASGRVNPNAKAVLQEEGAWEDAYHSKALEAIEGRVFDLVVTVCDHAKESCPLFPGGTPVIHVGFEDPDGQPIEVFRETLAQIKSKLLPAVAETLNHSSNHQKEIK